MRINRHARVCLMAALFFVVTNFAARAQDTTVIYRDVETKYVFGFTEGSGIGLEGEKEFSLDTEARIGKRDGRYQASETKLEFEFTPNQYVQFEFGPFISAHQIRDVTDLDNRNQVAFGGIFGEVRYLLLDRGPSSPLALTLSVEPEWRRIDETSGERVTNFELEAKLNADLELIKNRLYLGATFCTSRKRRTIRIISAPAGRWNRKAACRPPWPTASCPPSSSAPKYGICVTMTALGSTRSPAMRSMSGRLCSFNSLRKFS